MTSNKTWAITALSAVFALQANADNDKRLVLVEEFTNTGCSPCAEFAPYLDQALRERMDDVVAIKYHFNYPSASDPYYLNESDDIDQRATYYGITGVPTVIFNGTRCVNDETLLNTYIDHFVQDERLLDIDVKASLNDHKLAVNVAIDPLTTIHSDDLRAFVAVVEEWKVFDKAFSNGENEFYYVMQKMLPDGGGQQLGTVLTKGETTQFSTGWTVDHFYDETQLGIVTFVQDMTTGQVLHTVYTPYPTGSDDAAKILSVSGTPDYICSPQFSSDVVVRCTGKNGLRSANINVSINGAVQTTPWTGNLTYLQRDTVSTPTFTDFGFSTDSKTNDVHIWLSDINGTDEQSPKWSVTLHNSPQAKNAVRLSIMTDRKPEETTWQLLNSAGDVVDQGGPYDEPRKKYTKVLALDKDDCYTIEFTDAGGDGINGSNGAGYYKLDQLTSDGKSKMMVQATYETAHHEAHFSLSEADASLTVDDIHADTDAPIDIYSIDGRKITTTTSSELKRSTKGMSGTYIICTREKGDDVTKKITIK